MDGMDGRSTTIATTVASSSLEAGSGGSAGGGGMGWAHWLTAALLLLLLLPGPLYAQWQRRRRKHAAAPSSASSSLGGQHPILQAPQYRLPFLGFTVLQAVLGAAWILLWITAESILSQQSQSLVALYVALWAFGWALPLWILAVLMRGVFVLLRARVLASLTSDSLLDTSASSLCGPNMERRASTGCRSIATTASSSRSSTRRNHHRPRRRASVVTTSSRLSALSSTASSYSSAHPRSADTTTNDDDDYANHQQHYSSAKAGNGELFCASAMESRTSSTRPRRRKRESAVNSIPPLVSRHRRRNWKERVQAEDLTEVATELCWMFFGSMALLHAALTASLCLQLPSTAATFTATATDATTSGISLLASLLPSMYPTLVLIALYIFLFPPVLIWRITAVFPAAASSKPYASSDDSSPGLLLHCCVLQSIRMELVSYLVAWVVGLAFALVWWFVPAFTPFRAAVSPLWFAIAVPMAATQITVYWRYMLLRNPLAPNRRASIAVEQGLAVELREEQEITAGERWLRFKERMHRLSQLRLPGKRRKITVVDPQAYEGGSEEEMESYFSEEPSSYVEEDVVSSSAMEEEDLGMQKIPETIAEEDVPVVAMDGAPLPKIVTGLPCAAEQPLHVFRPILSAQQHPLSSTKPLVGVEWSTTDASSVPASPIISAPTSTAATVSPPSSPVTPTSPSSTSSPRLPRLNLDGKIIRVPSFQRLSARFKRPATPLEPEELTFDVVMANQRLREDFKQFCLSELSVENVLFYEDWMMMKERMSRRPSTTSIASPPVGSGATSALASRKRVTFMQSATGCASGGPMLPPPRTGSFTHAFENLLHLYILPNSQLELNLLSSTRAEILQKMDAAALGDLHNLDACLFDKAADEARQLMLTDTFPRYLRARQQLQLEKQRNRHFRKRLGGG